MTIRIILVGIILALMAGKTLAADNLALVIANKDYKNFTDARDAFAATELNATLVQAGFEVRTIRNMSRNAMERLAPVIRSEINAAERVLVFFSGHVFTTSRESWFMATDAPSQDGLLAGAYGLPISAVIDLLGEKAGAAILLVGDPGNPQRLGGGLNYGYVPNGIAQGVTVFTGRTGRLVSLVQDALLVPGTTTLSAAENAPRGVTGFGFLSRTVAFLPVQQNVPTTANPAVPVDDLELLVWENAKLGGTIDGLSAYLNRYPNGQFVAQALGMVANLNKSPAERAKDAELALRLGRNARRDIQRNLTLLDFDTRGVDGIFGPGSRKAVAAWQRSEGYPANGFLTERQISALEGAASVRGAELEEQARIRRLEQERRDAEYWRNTGRDGGEAGLRAYVKKYPDGLYSEIALGRLQIYDEQRRRTAEIVEGNAWDVAQESATADAYRNFLNNHPGGVFADSARERLAALEQVQVNPATVAEERSVLGSPITRILVEQKLAALGFKPGRVDGNIDDNTRRAVRQFQRAADVPVSGYVTQATIVRLLAAK